MDQPAAERAGMELRKACGCPAPERFLHLLDESECLEPWLAELAPGDRLARAATAVAAAARLAASGST